MQLKAVPHAPAGLIDRQPDRSHVDGSDLCRHGHEPDSGVIARNPVGYVADGVVHTSNAHHSTHRRSVVTILGALSNEIRLEILASLARPKHVAEIADELELDHSTVSHALRRLLSANLVTFKVAGKRRIYRLADHVRASIVDSRIQLQITSGGTTLIVGVPST